MERSLELDEGSKTREMDRPKRGEVQSCCEWIVASFFGSEIRNGNR